MNDEIAQGTVDQAIIDAAYEAARQNPDLKILCPLCSKSVLGVEFAGHAGEHGGQAEEAVRREIEAKREPACYCSSCKQRHCRTTQTCKEQCRHWRIVPNGRV